jgi:hypothetical protein
VLVHQYPGNGVAGLNLIGRIGALKVYSYAFDLASPALPEQEEQFGKAIFELSKNKFTNETPVASVA